MTWIIPFKGRGLSGPVNQNFLYQEKNVYVMDNHRAALWCWLRHIKENSNLDGLFHIDRHFDALQGDIDSWIRQSSCIKDLDIHAYLLKEDKDCGEKSVLLYRWDNYLSIFLALYGSKVSNCYFATHNDGDEPKHNFIEYVCPWEIPDNLDYWMKKGSWIVNVDLDYFFYDTGNEEFHLLYSDRYIADIFNKLKILLDCGSISVLTVCFSPECCGSWENSQYVWDIAQRCLDIEIQLGLR